MPLGFLTETPDGQGSEPHPEFAEWFGAREMTTADHAARTFANARDSDGTLWFGADDSTGASATFRAGHQLGRPALRVEEGVSKPSHVVDWLVANKVRVLNVAGNREGMTPGIGKRAGRFLGRVFRRLAEEGLIATKEG
jgi:hypothetical protein